MNYFKIYRDGVLGLLFACLSLACLSGGRAAADGLAPVAAHSFTGMDENGANADGALPLGGLTDGGDGYFYGATSAGGAAASGTVFRLRTDGTGFETLHSLDAATEGSGPAGALTLGGDGFLYGATSADGPQGAGTVFRLHLDGSGFSVLHTFDGLAGGGFCPAGVTPGGDGFLYGVAGGGDEAGDGTVFRLHLDGSGFETLHTFTGDTDGGWPLAALTQSGGSLYGTTFLGGAEAAGTVFRLAPDGSGFVTLHDFTGEEDGAAPAANLRDGGDGFLYGAALSGGDSDNGTVFRLAPDGSGFVTLHSFEGDSDGSEPLTAPCPGPDGRLYGTVYGGGASQCGTAYAMGTDGTGFTLLAAFSDDDAGGLPGGALLIGTGGRFYGTAYSGGAEEQGTVFYLDLSSVLVTTDTTVTTGRTLTTVTVTPPTPARAHLLWTTQAGGASLWTVEADGSYQHFEYGPFAGWTPAGLSTGPDGISHLLWRGVDGTLSLWNVNAQGSYAYRFYGPYSGWWPQMISADPDGGQWVVWTHVPDGQVSVWRLDANGVREGMALYGPFPGWKPVALASGPDGSVRLTWTHTPDGQMSQWELNPNTFGYTHNEFGPFGGWSAGAMAIDADAGSRVLWTHESGQISLWALHGAAFTHTEYGPYSGWRARGIADGANSPVRLLWTQPANGQAALWSLNNQGGYTYSLYGPYPGWSALAVSIGP